MRKLFILCALLVFSIGANTQIIKRIPSLQGKNLLDANKNYKLTAINFVPFVFTSELTQKGYTPEKIYTWNAPDGTQKRASGAEILKQVNEMEQELNKRGHSLRNRNTFANVSYDFSKMPKVVKIPKAVSKIRPTFSYNPKIPYTVDRAKRLKLPTTSLDLSKYIPGDVFVYFGALNRSNEFPGSLSMSTHVDNVKNPTSCPLDLTIALDGGKLSSLNISNCVLEISTNPNRKPNDNDAVVASTSFNFKQPSLTRGNPSGITFSGETPPSFYNLYYFSLTLQDLGKKMPMAKKSSTPQNYYAYVKFYNANNELLYYSSYNTATVGNVQDPPIRLAVNKSVSGSFEDAYTDPTGLFGIYYKGENIKAQYSLIPNAWEPVQESASLSAHVEIGAQYYNFAHLLDIDQPKVSKTPFISADVNAQYAQTYPSAVYIRIPTRSKQEDLNGYGNFKFDYTLFDRNYGKSSPTNQPYSLTPIALLPRQRFFIGPVPCFIQVDLIGTASMNRTATIDTLVDGKIGISTQFTPHLDLTVSGQGGVDASIAYAKVVANVNVINADMPIALNVANQNADIQADLKVNALSGQIYFEAGICIPIPFYDDLCKRFTIPIFNWTGPSKTYPLVK